MTAPLLIIGIKKIAARVGFGEKVTRSLIKQGIIPARYRAKDKAWIITDEKLREYADAYYISLQPPSSLVDI